MSGEDLASREHLNGQRVMVEGRYLGMSVGRLQLSVLRDPNPPQRITEVYFTTASGNIYSIGRPGNRVSENPNKDFAVMSTNGRDSLKYLTERDLKEGRLQLEESFRYGPSGVTTPVTKIVCVDTGREYTWDELIRLTGGSDDETRQIFWGIFNGKQR